jgi:translation initiation factor 2 gamma subunit (eIF-2gamma)
MVSASLNTTIYAVSASIGNNITAVSGSINTRIAAVSSSIDTRLNAVSQSLSSSINIPGTYANDTAAATAGVRIGGLYHTTGTVKVRLT